MKEKQIGCFKFSVDRLTNCQRLYISGLDEFSLHYDIRTTIDIILALIDFSRDHTWKELDYTFEHLMLYLQTKMHRFHPPTKLSI